MRKINFKTRKELHKLFESNDLETVLLGISLIRALEYYDEVKDNSVYLSIGGLRSLSETLNFIEEGINNGNSAIYDPLIKIIAEWLYTQKVI